MRIAFDLTLARDFWLTRPMRLACRRFPEPMLNYREKTRIRRRGVLRKTPLWLRKGVFPPKRPVSVVQYPKLPVDRSWSRSDMPASPQRV